MAKKPRTPSQSALERAEQAALLAQLNPAVELTPLIRPRLLLVAAGAHAQLLLGLLYHTRKAAWQWRLRLRSATHPGFAERARWRQYADVQAVETHTQARLTEFAELALQLGAPATLRLEFPPQALDDEILQLVSSLSSLYFPPELASHSSP